VEGRQLPGERDSLAMARERVSAWWTSVLAGQADQSHPIQGTHVSAHVDGDTLLVRGSVPSQEDLDEIRAEVEHLAGHGVARVQVEVAVEPRNTDEKGLLRQTLVGLFENREQAGFAAGYLEGHGHVARESMLVIEPEQSGEQERRDAVARLGAPFADDVRRRLEQGQSALVVSVDEVDAFRVRELLDEETRSLETLVLPPQPAKPARPAPNPGAEKAESTPAREAQDEALEREERAHAR
jgi:hypothetical protein